MNKCAGIFGFIFGHRFKERYLWNPRDDGRPVGKMTFCTRCGCEPSHK